MEKENQEIKADKHLSTKKGTNNRWWWWRRWKCEGWVRGEDVRAAPVQQGWQSAVGGRRDGEWCRCNSNSSGCPEEESPKSRPHRGETDSRTEGQGESEGHLRSVRQEEERTDAAFQKRATQSAEDEEGERQASDGKVTQLFTKLRGGGELGRESGGTSFIYLSRTHTHTHST